MEDQQQKKELKTNNKELIKMVIKQEKHKKCIITQKESKEWLNKGHLMIKKSRSFEKKIRTNLNKKEFQKIWMIKI